MSTWVRLHRGSAQIECYAGLAPGLERGQLQPVAVALRWKSSAAAMLCRLALLCVLPVTLTASTGLDESLPLGFRLNNLVKAIQVDPEGRVLIAGSFTELNGIACLTAACLTPDGSPDPSFELGRELDQNQRLNILSGGVRLLAPAGQRRLYAVGPFRVIQEGTAYRQAVRVQEDGQLDTQFNIGTAIEGRTVTTALVLPDHRLLIARRILREDNSIRASVALLDENGNLAPAFDSSLEANQLIHVLLRQPDGKILLAGGFTEIGGIVRDGIARLLTDGRLDESFDPGTTPDYSPTLRASQPIRSLALQSDGRILVAGSFTTIGGQQKAHVARLEADGRLDADFGVVLLPRFLNGPTRVNAVAVQPGDQIVIGGLFERVNGVRSPQAARILPDGSVDSSFETGHERLNEIFAFALQPDGSLLLGGGNETGTTVATGQVLRIKASGELDARFAMTGTAYHTGSVTSQSDAPSIRAIVVQSDGNLILGGRFTSFNRVAATHLARIGPDGALDRTFHPAVGGHAVNALTLDPGGRILVAGDFPGGLTRLLADGTVDPEFNVGEGVTLKAGTRDVWFVRCLAVQADGRIVVGGDFDWAGGATRRGLARFHPDGSLDVEFAPPLWADLGSPVVNAILMQSDGKLIIGGTFHRIGEVPRNALARLYPNGEVDETFDAAAHTSSGVYALRFDKAGNILIGGDNLQVAGLAVDALARVNASGSLDATFRPVFGAWQATAPRVGSIAVQPDGMILVGGLYGSVDGVAHRGLARLTPDGAVDPDFHVGKGLETSSSHISVRFVWTLVLDSDGQLLVGGDFIQADGTARGGLARWRTGLTQRNRLWLWRDPSIANGFRLRLGAPVLAGTRIDIRGRGTRSSTRRTAHPFVLVRRRRSRPRVLMTWPFEDEGRDRARGGPRIPSSSSVVVVLVLGF
jgi:uncharacterized delta-60 repeat protein